MTFKNTTASTFDVSLFFLTGDAGFSLCRGGRSQSHWRESLVSDGHALVGSSLALPIKVDTLYFWYFSQLLLLFLYIHIRNPALEDQACDRIYRVGQTRDVTIHRLEPPTQ